jgi:hypothetical protein
MKRFIFLLFIILSMSGYSQETADTLGIEIDQTLFDLGFEPDSLGQEMAGDSSAYYLNSDSNGDDYLVDESLLSDSTDLSISGIEDTLNNRSGSMYVEVLGAALVGYTVGLDFGHPAYKHGGLGNNFDQSNLAFGLTVNTPYGAAIGPFEIGFGVQWGLFKFSSSTVPGHELSGIYMLGTANTSIYETLHGTISTQVGAGYYGASIGITAGVAIDYVVPDLPLVIKPYIRANATLDSGVIPTDTGDTPSYAWFNIGIMGSYDISTLF